MAPIDLNDVRAFLDVHATGSFSLAARKAGVPRSTVSRAVTALERALGVRLFYRTTRRVSTTSAGEALAARVSSPLASIEASLDALPERADEPSGLLRVTSTPDLGAVVLAEATARFTARHPAVSVQLHLTGQIVDLVGRGFDLALRVLAKPPRDSTLVARKVGSMVFGLYAAPAYLARRGAPRREEDLDEHDGVSFEGGLRRKSFRILCDDIPAAREMLRAGVGVGALPSFMAEADVAAGTLVRVIPRWDVHSGSVYVVVPGQKHLAPKVKAFRALVLEMLRRRPLL